MKEFKIALLGMLMGVLAGMASASSGQVGDVSVGDFPRLAGETGDSARIQRAVASAGAGRVVWFPRGEYAIDAMLEVTNHTSLLLHSAAHLKAVKTMPFVLHYEAPPRDLYAQTPFKPGEFNLFIRGGEFDGAGLASCALVMGRWHFTIADATFRNGRQVGLQFGTKKNWKGWENIAHNLYFICDMPGLPGNVGLLTHVGDSHFTDIVVVDYTVGIRDQRWSNRFTRCHVWGGPVKKPGTDQSEYLSNSVAFDLVGADAVLDGCCADTAMVGFKVHHDVRIINSTYYNNWSFKMDNPTVFAHHGGSLIVTGGRFTKTSSNATLYRRGKKAGRLIWRDNQMFNFKPADLKGLNDELKKSGVTDSAAKSDAKFAE